MSFFAGVFGAPQKSAMELTRSGMEKALRVNAGARIWSVPEQGILSHIQSLITAEDRSERLPLLFEGGRKALVFDGRLDNREDLIRSLGLRGDRKALSDGDLVAAAIERWEEDACRRLLGDFAYACWDVAARRLILACDPMGGRAILYHANAQRIVFATTVDAMLAFPGVSHDVDLSCVANLLLDGMPPLGSTGFRDIKQVPAAHTLTWSAGGVSIRRYWRPDFTTSVRYQREEDYVEHARELLDEAVRCRLRTTGPVACQLSGGFDASGVTATAARLNAPRSVLSITAVPQTGVPLCPTGGRIFVDEWKHASAVAAMHPNIEAYAAPAAPPSYVDPRILFHYRGMPVRDFLNVSWFSTANRMARELGAKTLLVGGAGSLTLSWSGLQGIGDLAQLQSLWAFRREVLGLSKQGIQSPWRTLRNEVVPTLVPAKVRHALARRQRAAAPAWHKASAISAEFAGASDAETIAAETATVIPGLGRGDSARLRSLEQIWHRPDNALLRPFYGLERRDPLADIRLVEFCIALPPEQYLYAGVTRRLARRALADRVPEVVLRENRVGRQNPDWYFRLSHARGQMRTTIDRLQRSPLANYALDLHRMKSILENWPADATDAQEQSAELIGVLARGVNVGEFLEWTEGGCVPSSYAVDRTPALRADPLVLAS